MILAASPEGRKRLQQAQSPWSVLSRKLQEFLLLAGITVHYVLRKRYIEDQTRQAIKQGVTQVVNLGAGFDSLAWRLHKQHPEVNFVEIDHPQINKLKTQALLGQDPDVQNVAQASNMHFLSVDFTQQDLQSALGGCADFDSSRATLYICEGVMMYLEAAEIKGVFDAIEQLSGQGSLLLFSCIEPQHSDKNNVRNLLFSYLKLIGEPIKWVLKSEEIPAFLSQHNCELQQMAATDELKQRYITKKSDYTYHHGEYLVLCRFVQPKADVACVAG